MQKTLDLAKADKKQIPDLIAGAYAGIGEVDARTGKIDDAAAAYDEAAKANPAPAIAKSTTLEGSGATTTLRAIGSWKPSKA